MQIKKAFTMAEAILVMTVLGIIATIMITTLRPSEFQEKGLQILAKKVLSEIDTATSNVLFNDSADSTFDHLYKNGTTTMFTAGNAVAGVEVGEESEWLAELYKKYMVTVRREVKSELPFINTYGAPLALKNGAEMGIFFSTGGVSGGTSFPTIFPGETNATTIQCPYGIIVFDINGEDGPNLQGKDQFWVPLGKNGILYE